MDRIIVLIDYNGLALGAVCMHEQNVFLVDMLGKIVQEVSIKTTIKKAKDILIRRRANYVT